MHKVGNLAKPFRVPSEMSKRISMAPDLDKFSRYINEPFRMKIRITKEQKCDLLEAFNLFDLDGDGKVTNSELRVAIRALGFEVTPEDIKKLKESANICVGVDSLSFQNFMDLMETRMLQRDETEEIIKYFNLIDVDGRGKINFIKLKRVAKALGEDVSDEMLVEMLNEAGQDEVTVDELIKFIRSSTIRLQELYNKR